MLNIAFCDENFMELDLLENVLDDYMNMNGIEYTIKKFPTTRDLLTFNTSFDLVFMDTEFSSNDISGIEAAQKLRKNDRDILLFYVTKNNSIDNMRNGYRAQVSGFFQKPINKEEIILELDYQKSKLTNQNKYIYDKRVSPNKIYISQILYIEFLNRKSIIHTEKCNYPSYIALKEWNKNLENYEFKLCHNSYLVNLFKISELDGSVLTMSNGKNITISRTYKDAFLVRYYNHLKENH